ncbi:hypothetical protein ACFORJ_00740 [Corynebacterium hansenii]|uniref:Uncharacterized protein n=1 Tax=Corynebacterium hansenii TaxID=394964 RepID=A0ABV7ZJH1_9CORY|nr:hypothetical protein [Corynebacterium hansenii]WJY99472.1 hypothetical protein CHAN_04245 [Corynebacterium hansenii]
MIRDLGEKYSPLYFLAALGFGGMSVFFFMAFMHITPHPDTPMPTFESIQNAWATGGTFLKSAIAIGYAGMIAMFAVHLFLLAWNIREFAQFRRTPAYRTLKSTNAEVTLMAIPLTLGMTVNGMFVAAMALVPGLWGVIENLMPLALLAYGSVGALALVIMSAYLKRVIAAGFDFKANGGLNQLLSAFAFTMVAVGFAAPAAMSGNKTIVLIALLGSLFFGSVAVLLFTVFLPLGVMSMLRYGLSLQNSATLWLAVPISTLLAITMLRLRHGLQTLETFSPAHEGAVHAKSSIPVLVMLAAAIMFQMTFLGLGHLVMRANGFYREYVFGRETASPAAFTLVCPGVGLSVLSMFALHVGLVANGLVEKFSVIYYVLLAIIVAVASVTLWTAVTLFRNQLSTSGAIARTRAAAPSAPIASAATPEKIDA